MTGSNRRFLPKGLAAIVALTALASGSAVSSQPPRPKPGKVAPGTIGTKQLSGTDAAIGTTYSLKPGVYTPSFNFTLLEAAYSVDAINIEPYSYLPSSEEKFLVLRYQLHNPQKRDIQVQMDALASRLFQAVAEDNKTYDARRTSRAGMVEGDYDPLKPLRSGKLVLKPGQKSPVLVSVITVPAKGVVPKLIIQQGRIGTSEKVLRYDLRGKVRALASPYLDPDSTDGATPRNPLPGEIGKVYTLGTLQFTLEKLEYSTEPLDRVKLKPGERLLVGTGHMRYFGARRGSVFNAANSLTPILTDSDGEKRHYKRPPLLATRDAVFSTITYEPGEEKRFRFYFVLPEGVSGQKLLIDNSSYRKTIRAVEYMIPETL